jgi:DUF4097 and DUF4098 domain-containing protein YvlB
MVHALLVAALAASLQQQTDTTFSVRGNGHIEFDSYAGRIAVRSWDRNDVRIRARHGNSVRVDIEHTGNAIQVEPVSRRGLAGPVDFDVTVPRSFGIEIDAINVEIDIADVNGDIHAETVNGNVNLRGVAGRIHAETTQGKVIIRDSRGTLQAETVNEGIEITNHTGDLDAESINGSITLTGIRAGVVSAETVNGSVQYDGEIRDGGRYNLSTHNGTITMVVPQGTNATVSVDTYQGELDADFPIELRGRAGHDRMSFTIGNGGARLELSSFGGNIRLRRPGARVER